MRNGAFLQASKALEQAVADDNKFALAHARLAEAWFELDYADKAKDEMLRVQSLVPNRSQLATSDALYLEAINATVTKDFPGAIKAYTDLARLLPNDPSVYVDLGRAYEKNEELKKAIESYVEATNRDPQYATAFLRVGSLYARQLDQERYHRVSIAPRPSTRHVATMKDRPKYRFSVASCSTRSAKFQKLVNI